VKTEANAGAEDKEADNGDGAAAGEEKESPELKGVGGPKANNAAAAPPGDVPAQPADKPPAANPRKRKRAKRIGGADLLSFLRKSDKKAEAQHDRALAIMEENSKQNAEQSRILNQLLLRMAPPAPADGD